jgi:conjugative transfer signal peptidase TraF
LIAFCPPATQAFEKNNFDFVPKNGICQNGYKILLKKIVGVENDVVEVNSQVFINGEPVKNSTIQIYLSNWISLSPCFGKHVLKKDKFFVMSDSNLQSFDSRYFCEINKSDILGVVEKL